MTDKSIRIGVDDFSELRGDNGYFVDKTPLIREVIAGAKVTLLPRPRRFGKTLNLSMLRYFFERVDDAEKQAERRALFDGLHITGDPEIMLHCGRYPTIFLTLKNVRGKTWEETYEALLNVVNRQFALYPELRDCVRTARERENFDSLYEGHPTPAVLKASLDFLIDLLYRCSGEPVVVLIDEYDSPAIEAFRRGYLEDMLEFLRAWLGAGLKHENGPALYRAVITGILRIAKESIFSGLNNLDVATTLKIGPFADKFGFTEPEVEQLLRDYDCEDRMVKVREWYNGYKFGNTVMYNPWSVLKYVKDLPNLAGPQWLNTSSNTLVHQELEAGGAGVRRDLEKLLAGDELRYPIYEDTVFSAVGRTPETIWSFLYFAGYLRAEDPQSRPGRDDQLYYRLSIPNREVRVAYREFVHRSLWKEHQGNLDAFLDCFLYPEQLNGLENVLRELVCALMSYHDAGRYPEAVYHAFVLGLLANLRNVYDIRSEPETGYGRADILMVPKTEDFPLGFVIEFKSLDYDADFDAAEATAFTQIEEKNYVSRLLEAGVVPANIRKLVVLVRGKDVRVGVGEGR